MAPEEAQSNAPRRRGRPPGSKTRRRRATRGGGSDLVGQLNAMVAELIKKNKQLERQNAKLAEKAGASKSDKGVERGLRTISRRVQKALGSKSTRTRKAAPANGRRRRTATTRRRRAS